MLRKKSNPYVGSNFESFLEEESRLGRATLLAAKRVLAREIQAPNKSKVTRADRAANEHAQKQ